MANEKLKKDDEIVERSDKTDEVSTGRRDAVTKMAYASPVIAGLLLSKRAAAQFSPPPPPGA